MTEIATVEPTRIVAGDRLQWRRDLADYPAGAWALSYAFRNSASAFDVAASSDGTTHVVDVPPTTSAKWAPGRYSVLGFVVGVNDRRTVYEGEIVVAPNLASADPVDTRTHARKVLDAIEAVIENRATQSDLNYSIEGRSLGRIPHNELVRLRRQYRREVNAEIDAARVRDGKPSRRLQYGSFK